MQKDLPLLNWLVTDDDRTRAQLKYDIKHLEFHLATLVLRQPKANEISVEIQDIAHSLAKHYQLYLHVITDKNPEHIVHHKHEPEAITWQQQYMEIGHLKQQLLHNTNRGEIALLMSRMIGLYQQLTTGGDRTIPIIDYQNAEAQKLAHDLWLLFLQRDVKSWLYALVEFWNYHNEKHIDYSLLFHQWSEAQYVTALNFFAKEKIINLANAFFFYKLYPDRLFNTLIHPEKLVSIRMRLALLHEFIEQLHRQLYTAALQHNLNPNIDFLFHGNELPQGIMIEVDDECSTVIQRAIKYLKVTISSDSEQKITHDRLLDFGCAYKFWFNPNRLIDAVMVLLHRLGKKDGHGNADLVLFQQEMVSLYHRLTMTECLDLYGNFANKNSRYLLYTLYSIIVGRTFPWLSPLSDRQRQAVEQVFKALCCVMEALRIELKNRHVHTEPYVDNLHKINLNPGRRNRAVIERIVLVYADTPNVANESIDSLFNELEQAQTPLSS